MNNANDNSVDDNQVDDTQLDEYLSGSTPHSLRYRKIQADEVPVEMDRIVLGQAAKASNATTVTPIESAQSKRSLNQGTLKQGSLIRWMRVGAPVALAASFVLVVSLVIQNGVPRKESVKPVTSDEPLAESKSVSESFAGDAAEPMAAKAVPAEERARQETYDITSEAEKKQSQGLARSARRTDELNQVSARAQKPNLIASDMPRPTASRIASAPIVSTPIVSTPIASTPIASAPMPEAASRAAAAPAASPTSIAKSSFSDAAQSATDKGKLEEAIVASDTQRTLASANTGQITLQTTKEQRAKEQREVNPTAWLEYIRQLRTSNHPREANSEWQRFVKAYPQFPVAEGDLARAK